MAEIVFGAGSSHSPMTLLDADGWAEWAKGRDASMTDLVDEVGVAHSYDEWVARNDGRLEPELTAEVMAAKVQRCAEARAELAARVASAALDALVIVGDDQDEHLDIRNLPPILIYHGAELINTPSPLTDSVPAILRAAMGGYYEQDGNRTYPVDVALAEHLIGHLLDNGFDVATSAELPVDRPEGHAFQFVHRHLTPPGLATVPIMLNTYLPPAQPRASRCVQLGRAVVDAVAALDGNRRVGIVASGGLSHFRVDEVLDRRVLDACRAGDTDDLAAIPEALLQSGSSEIKNWITVAAACGHLDFDVIDYVPGYRTPAGTGTGLAFATWGPR